MKKIPIVVLISGSGSNLQSIIDAAELPDFPCQVVGVISNKADAFGLVRAQKHGIETRVLNHKEFDSREAFDEALAHTIDVFQPELVVLAGFMRILTPNFVNRYLGRILNIHPSLLPLYPGLHTHRRAIEAGDAFHGATVHFVTAELDGGPAIVQAKVAIESGDTEETLAKRVLEKEHKIYPLAIQWFAENKIVLADGKTVFEGRTLPASGIDFSNLES